MRHIPPGYEMVPCDARLNHHCPDIQPVLCHTTRQRPEILPWIILCPECDLQVGTVSQDIVIREWNENVIDQGGSQPDG